MSTEEATPPLKKVKKSKTPKDPAPTVIICQIPEGLQVDERVMKLYYSLEGCHHAIKPLEFMIRQARVLKTMREKQLQKEKYRKEYNQSEEVRQRYEEAKKDAEKQKKKKEYSEKKEVKERKKETSAIRRNIAKALKELDRDLYEKAIEKAKENVKKRPREEEIQEIKDQIQTAINAPEFPNIEKDSIRVLPKKTREVARKHTNHHGTKSVKHTRHEASQ